MGTVTDAGSLALGALAAAINRASGLLNAVGDLYTASSDAFSGGNAFTAHAVATAQGLLADAASAMTDLYEAMDERAATLEADRQVLEEALASAQAQVAAHLPVDESMHVDQLALAEHAAPVADHPADLRESFVESYQELLRKVTAVEVFAADQENRAEDVLPLVQSLREQLQELNRVA